MNLELPEQLTNSDLAKYFFPGFTETRLRDINSYFGALDLRKISQDLKQEEKHNKSSARSLAKGDYARQIALEGAGLAGIFISPVWKNAREKIGHSPTGLLRKRGGTFEDLSSQNLEEELNGKETPHEVITVLDGYMNNVFEQAAGQWQEHMDKKIGYSSVGAEVKSLTDPMDRAYKRYRDVVRMEMNKVAQPVSSNDRDLDLDLLMRRANQPQHHINGGFITGLDISWGFAGVGQRVFKEQFHKNPSEEQLLKLVQHNRSRAVSLAQSDISVIINFGSMCEKEGGQADNLLEDKFFIAQKADLQTLELRPEVLDFLQAEAFKRSKDPSKYLTTRCAALVAPGTEGRNVLGEFYDWFLDIYQKHYLPQMRRLGETKD